MFARLGGTAALAFALLTPSTLTAQTEARQPNLIVFGNGGGASSLTDLNDAGTASLKTGWTAGGGIGVQLNPYVALRGTFDFARPEAEGTGAGSLEGQKLNQYYYGGDVQLRYPTASGISPYLLLGAGAVTIDNSDNAAFESFTKFAGKGGLGVEYALPRSNLGLFGQASSYIYDNDRNGFDKTQVDVLWTAGVSYRFSY
jgi:hypothetical protein